MYFLASDVGGTFVDLVLFDPVGGKLFTDKVPSTGESAEGILHGVRRILGTAGVSTADVRRFVHGSTIATNIWITRRGARVAFLVTDRFRDVLEIGTQRRAELHSLTQRRAQPLAPRSQAVEVMERLDASGDVVIALAQGEIARVVQAISEISPQSIAISLLYSFLDDRHEAALARALGGAFPALPVYVSSAINPQIGEYARTNTTVAAAYVGPAMEHYISALEHGLQQAGYGAPLMLMRSDDGVATPQAARRNPVTMLLSGPAGGVIAAAHLSREIGAPDLVTFDMGGTSADFSLIVGGRPRISNERSLGDQPLRIPMLDIETISSGGGSLASVDHAGALRVGPQSAGAVPGPACYGKGGAQPTLTDAALVLGIISPVDFAGGELELLEHPARKAIETRVAEPLGMDVEQAALGMIAVACAQMRQAIRALTIERGFDIRRFSLLAFGGAGPIFAALMQPDLGVEQLLIPPRPGVFAAGGLLLADIKHNNQTPYPKAFKDVAPGDLRAQFDVLRTALDAALESDGVAAARRSFQFSADLRYVGQFHDITVPLRTPDNADWWNRASVADHFHGLHEQTYGHADPTSEVEIVNLRAEAVGNVDKPLLPTLNSRSGRPAVPRDRRRILLERRGEWRECPVYSRDDLKADDRLDGPAIVSQSDTTVLILPTQRALVDAHGVIHIRSAEKT